LLGILPGSWGPDQTGVADSVPSPTGDIAFWLFALEVPQKDGPVERLRMEPLASIEEGAGIVVGAVTAFRGTASPLAIQPRRTLRVEAADANDAELDVDLGQVFRRRPAPTPDSGERHDAGDGIVGWGTPRRDGDPATGMVVDLAVAPDATLTIGPAHIAAAELPPEGGDGRATGSRSRRSRRRPTASRSRSSTLPRAGRRRHGSASSRRTAATSRHSAIATR
jgi:hypothetical protein